MRTILGVRKFFEVSGHLRHPDKLGGSTTRWNAHAGLGAYDGVPAPASQLEYWMPELMHVGCPVARVNKSQTRVAPVTHVRRRPHSPHACFNFAKSPYSFSTMMR